jgi:6,7-dimethyl-8-ribityllumazine synthase
MAIQPTDFLDKDYSHLNEKKVTIVSTTWNKEINEALVKGAVEILGRYNQINIEYLEVPGSVELAYAIKQHSLKHKTDAYIAFGCVIRGGTPHFDYVCEAANNSIAQLNLSLNAPVIFGVLTLENEAQAWERLGGTHGHKGKEAAQTALAMMEFKQNL